MARLRRRADLAGAAPAHQGRRPAQLSAVAPTGTRAATLDPRGRPAQARDRCACCGASCSRDPGAPARTALPAVPATTPAQLPAAPRCACQRRRGRLDGLRTRGLRLARRSSGFGADEARRVLRASVHQPRCRAIGCMRQRGRSCSTIRAMPCRDSTARGHGPTAEAAHDDTQRAATADHASACSSAHAVEHRAAAGQAAGDASARLAGSGEERGSRLGSYGTTSHRMADAARMQPSPIGVTGGSRWPARACGYLALAAMRERPVSPAVEQSSCSTAVQARQRDAQARARRAAGCAALPRWNLRANHSRRGRRAR